MPHRFVHSYWNDVRVATLTIKFSCSLGVEEKRRITCTRLIGKTSKSGLKATSKSSLLSVESRRIKYTSKIKFEATLRRKCGI